MEIVKVMVKAGINGLHGLSGLFLQAGNEHDIDRKHFGHEIMEPVDWTPTDEEMGIKPAEPAVGGVQEVENVKEALAEAADKED